MATDGLRPDTSHPPVLIGRTDELTRLSDIADLSVEHGVQMVLVSGEAGIGKSTLVGASFADRGAGGWGRHVGHCIEYADRPLPFGPIVTILRSLLLDNLNVVDDIVGRRRADLSGLLPELAEEESGGASLVGDVDRLHDAIAMTITEASRIRPVAVLVEDIHWADAATRDLVAALARCLTSARVLLVVTERSGAVDRAHPLRTWLAEHRRLPNFHSFELEGLGREELAAQAMSVLGEPADLGLVNELLERTGGNPYFSRELLFARRSGTHALPTSLVEFLNSRIQRLSDAEREVLRAVAVAGGTISHQMLAGMFPDLPIGEIVRDLYDASILVVDGVDYGFGHALVREAILKDVLPFEAEDMHRRVAEAMTADPRRGSSLSDIASLAVHWGQANDSNRSLAAAVMAAEAAATVAAYETAAEMAVQALWAWPAATAPEESTLLTRDQLLLQAAEYLASCYRGAEAVQMINETLSGWAKPLSNGRRALLLAQMAPIHWHLGNPGETARVLEEAKRLVGDEISPEAAQVHHRLSKQALADGQINPALEAAERAIEIASGDGPQVVLVEALTTKALAIGVTGDLNGGVALAREARQLALVDGFVSQVANTYRTEMLIIVFQNGRTDACLEASREGLAYAKEHCGPRWRAEFRLDLCLGYVEGGRLRAAEPLIELLLSSELDDLRRLTVFQTAGLHALATDSLKSAEAFLADATEIAVRYQSAQETGFQLRLLAELSRRQGDIDTALKLIDQALELQLAGDNLTYTRESIVEKIRIARASFDFGRDDAAQLVANAATLVHEFDGTGKANEAMRALMELEITSINETIDADAAAMTIELLESAGYLYEAGQARLLLIEHLIAGQGTDRHVLAAALSELHKIATTHGIKWVAQRAASLAKVARVALDTSEEHEPSRSSRSPVGNPHHLTDREVEVMSLLAEGLTNKAIGERLFVSPRTVGTHISNLLAKLGVSNRGEAAAAFHRLGLADVIDLRDPPGADDVSAMTQETRRK